MTHHKMLVIMNSEGIVIHMVTAMSYTYIVVYSNFKDEVINRMKKQELFEKADEYKRLIEKNRPVSSEQLKEIDQFYRTSFTYSSNALAGNELTMTETMSLLKDGLRLGDKSMKDYVEASCYAEAYDYMLTLAGSEELMISEAAIKMLHYIFYQELDPAEAGQYRTCTDASEGGKLQPPKPEEVAHFMEHFMNQMQSSIRFLHPIEFAAICHKRLLDIHPFKAGNGRIARLFMNLILVHEGYAVTSIMPELRKEYFQALTLSQQINQLDIDTLIEFVAERVIEAERDYCRLLGIN